MQLRNMCLCDYRGTLPSPSVDMKPTQRWGGWFWFFLRWGFLFVLGVGEGGVFAFGFVLVFASFFFF